MCIRDSRREQRKVRSPRGGGGEGARKELGSSPRARREEILSRSAPVSDADSTFAPPNLRRAPRRFVLCRPRFFLRAVSDGRIPNRQRRIDGFSEQIPRKRGSLDVHG